MTMVRQILELYGRDTLPPTGFGLLVAGFDPGRAPFNVNVALARLASRFPEAAESHPILPRLQGLNRKLLVQDALQWSRAVPFLTHFQEAGIRVYLNGGAGLWLGALRDQPRKMNGVDIWVEGKNFQTARHILGGRTVRKKKETVLTLQDALFRIPTLPEGTPEGFLPFRDPSGVEVFLPGTELQFLLLCANYLNGITGDSFQDSCLQWMMDAIDIVRSQAGFDWQRLISLAAGYGELGCLMEALSLLRGLCPSRFKTVFPGGYALNPAEKVWAQRRERFLSLDRKCREKEYRGKPFPFFHRLSYRLRSNHYDLARYYPDASDAAVLFRAPRYYWKKYVLNGFFLFVKKTPGKGGTGAE